jgi:hypothetical protein
MPPGLGRAASSGLTSLRTRPGRSLLVGAFDHRFTGAFGKNLVAFPQDVLEVSFQRCPEVVLRRALHRCGRIVAATGGAPCRAGAGRGNLRVDRNRARQLPRHVDVVNLVVAQKGRIRHDQQVGTIEFPAHVDLLGSRARICCSVWSMALIVTTPLMPGCTSTLSLASRASANSRSCTGMLRTETE